MEGGGRREVEKCFVPFLHRRKLRLGISIHFLKSHKKHIQPACRTWVIMWEIMIYRGVEKSKMTY